MQCGVKFGVIADLHVDIIFDGKKRLQHFLDSCRKENVDFIIQLGDFIYPNTSKQCVCKPSNTPINIKNAMIQPTTVDKEEIVDLYKNFEKPHFHVLGNHDLDFCSKSEMGDYLGMEAPEYVFCKGGVTFIVLDCNFYKENNEYINYCYGNYFDSKDLPYISDTQLEWLKKQLWTHIGTPIVLFSHQRLAQFPDGIKNYKDLQDLLYHYNQTGGMAILSINGHNHLDGIEKIKGVYFFDVNSSSNHWLGEDYINKRFSQAIEKDFPNLRYTAPYQDSLFAIVKINDDEVKITGTSSQFISPSPKDLNFPVHCTSVISDYFLKYR